MSDADRACARACLASVEANLAELRQIKDWWKLLSVRNRVVFREFEADVQAYQHGLQK